MSSIINIILSIESLDEDEDKKASEVNLYFEKEDIRGFVSLEAPELPKRWYGGSKNLEANIYLGVFNYLKLSELIKHIKTINWKGPTSVQLLVKDQEDPSFKTYDIINQGWEE